METLCAPRPPVGSSFLSNLVFGVGTPEETAFLESWDADIRKSATANARIANLIDGEAEDLAQEARIKLLRLSRGKKITVPNYVRTAIKNSMLRARSRIRGTCDKGRHTTSPAVTHYPPSEGVLGLEDTSISGMEADDYEMGSRQRAIASVVLKEIAAEYLETMGLRHWIRQLPEQLRRIYTYIYVHGLSQRETAHLMGVSQPRVAELHRLLLQRGRAELAC